MPYALCPMPYAHEYLIFLRKAIVRYVKALILDLYSQKLFFNFNLKGCEGGLCVCSRDNHRSI